MLILLEKAVIYGCLGLLIEVFFTGISSLIRKHWDATCKTYLWMGPIYGVTALILEAVSDAITWPFYLKAFIYVPIIYGAEGLSAWVLKSIIGRVPWDYGLSHWTPMGFVNFSYLPFWLILALGFDAIAEIIRKIIIFAGSQLLM